ncbi:MAG: CHAT domain-containing protein [Myxococcota bacterium]
MTREDFTLTVSIHRFGPSYQVELRHRDPDSQAETQSQRGAVSFDLGQLLEKELTGYGEALAAQRFDDDEIKKRFLDVARMAESRDAGLRISLSIDPSAQELQSLRWELLCHPETGKRLTMSKSVYLSRFMVSRDWRPVKLRPKNMLRALIVVSAPTSMPKGLSAIEFDNEVEAVKPALELDGIELDVLGGPGAPVTLRSLLAKLREGVDIVYLVSHGMFSRRSGNPALVLQDKAGAAKITGGERITDQVETLSHPPRLWVLASCQSAGDGGQLQQQDKSTAQATLAGRLADAGVPALVAMQGFISVQTVAEMMPVFFIELLRDGRIDRALTVARSAVCERHDDWMPALYTRLVGGRLWYEARFADDNPDEIWRKLVPSVRNGKLVPVIGARLLEGVHGGAHDVAGRLARDSGFPLARYHWDDLPRVTEYIAVNSSRYNVIETYKAQLIANLVRQHKLPGIKPKHPPPTSRLVELVETVGAHQRKDPNDPHRLLAELPASVYVTTTFDPLLERALEAKGRSPQSMCTGWRHESDLPDQEDKDESKTKRPDECAPIVYHAFGAFDANSDESLVLTEDDYLDYLLQARELNLVPKVIERALVDNSLLFLGFRLTDWHFRVLFRLMMGLPGRKRLERYCHVAVQVDPDMQTMADVEGVRTYLSTYFGKQANISIYWGSSAEFLVALRDALEISEDEDDGGDDDAGDDDDGDDDDDDDYDDYE